MRLWPWGRRLLPGARNQTRCVQRYHGRPDPTALCLNNKAPVKLNKITNFTVDFPPALLGSLPLLACLHALQGTVLDQTSSRVLHRGSI